jgi:hypothetical protein
MQIGAAVAALRRQAFVWLLFRTRRITVVNLIQSASNMHIHSYAYSFLYIHAYTFLYLYVICKYLHVTVKEISRLPIVCVHHFMEFKYICNLLSLFASNIHICFSNFPTSAS